MTASASFGSNQYGGPISEGLYAKSLQEPETSIVLSGIIVRFLVLLG